MFDTFIRYLAGVPGEREQRSIRAALDPTVNRMSSQAMNAAGLVISSGGATTAKTGVSDCYLVANGVGVKVAAATTLPALIGITAAQNSFVWVMFFVDQAGVVTVAGGTPGTTLAKAGWPQLPHSKALLGTLLITNTGGAFTGGTTALDTATTVYIDAKSGAFDPTVLSGF